MKKLYVSPIAIELDSIKLALEDAGINCFIQNRFPPAAGDVPPIAAWPTLMVMDDEKSEEAKDILQKVLANQNQISQAAPWCKC